jgi:hypothetical protein
MKIDFKVKEITVGIRENEFVKMEGVEYSLSEVSAESIKEILSVVRDLNGVEEVKVETGAVNSLNNNISTLKAMIMDQIGSMKQRF